MSNTVTVRALTDFASRKEGSTWQVPAVSADYLIEHDLVELVDGDDVPQVEPSADDDHADDESPGARPAGNASRDEWVAYAVEQGVDVDTLAGATRDEIRALFPAD